MPEKVASLAFQYQIEREGNGHNILLPQNLCDLFLIIFKITNFFLLKMIVLLYLSDND